MAVHWRNAVLQSLYYGVCPAESVGNVWIGNCVIDSIRIWNFFHFPNTLPKRISSD